MRMSKTISRSRMKPGRGVINATTIARTAMGTARPVQAEVGTDLSQVNRLDGAAGVGVAVIGSPRQPALHEFEDVGENLGHGAIKVRGNFLAGFDGLVQRLRQRRVFDHWDLV